jgi:large subunit ribosomal protein L25
MTAKIDINAEARSQIGKRPSRRLRHSNKVPATVYGASKTPMAIMLDHHKVLKAMESEAFYSSILTLNIDNQPEKVVIKAIQRHPSEPRINHMDFYRINPKEKLNMHIPLHFLGEATCPGVKAGGVVSHYMNEVEVRCLPADLPEFIDVDLSQLEMNQSFHLSDLKLPQGVELVAFIHGQIEERNKPIANAHMPHIIKEPEITAPVSPEVEATRVSAEKVEETAEAGKEGKEAKEGKESKEKEVKEGGGGKESKAK